MAQFQIMDKYQHQLTPVLNQDRACEPSVAMYHELRYIFILEIKFGIPTAVLSS